jgi:NDP-sugar pyrophosphorylase family protein
MKALVLAAGEGTRLRPLTLDRPKPMLPIGDRPLLEHLVGWLRRHGVVKIAINLHHRPEAIRDHFGDGSAFGVTITYSYEEKLLGTAGAARRLQDFLDEPFVVVYGDVYTNLDLGALCAFHHGQVRRRIGEGPAGGPLLTLSLYRVANPTACGIVALDGQGQVTRFVEKPAPDQVFSDLANAGVMVVEPGILAHVPEDVVYDFGHDLLPQLLEAGVPVCGLPIAAGTYLLDIGTPEGYSRALQVWRQHRPSIVEQRT